MGCLHECKIICQTTQKLIMVLLFFLILTSSSHMIFFLAEGRVMLKQGEASQKYAREENIVKMRYLIGSSPPRCDKMRCVSCGHCEPVQVPIAPTIKHEIFKAEHAHHLHFYEKTPTIAYSRGDGLSNYMPMCWKCKCGDYIFNP